MLPGLLNSRTETNKPNSNQAIRYSSRKSMNSTYDHHSYTNCSYQSVILYYSSYNHQFNWWFIISPPKGYCYCSPQRAVSQALLLVRYKAVLLESSFLVSSACSFIYFCTASSVTLPIVST